MAELKQNSTISQFGILYYVNDDVRQWYYSKFESIIYLAITGSHFLSQILIIDCPTKNDINKEIKGKYIIFKKKNLKALKKESSRIKCSNLTRI